MADQKDNGSRDQSTAGRVGDLFSLPDPVRELRSESNQSAITAAIEKANKIAARQRDASSDGVTDEGTSVTSTARERFAAASGGTSRQVAPRQQDFFLADLVDAAVKGDQASMEAPVYSLTHGKDMTTSRWTSSDGKKTIEVVGGIDGRATQHDKDILIYCTSQLMAAANAGNPTSQTVRFSVYDFLLSTKRVGKWAPGGNEYARVKGALARLSGTQLRTNMIKNAASKTPSGSGFFNLISSGEIIEITSGDTRSTMVEVTLSKWIYDAITERNVLTIDPGYFSLRKPLARRLYEIARKHVGRQSSWEIGLVALREKCGVSPTKRNDHFRNDLAAILKEDNLPGYSFVLIGTGKEGSVRFYSRDALPPAAARIG
jgi:hypothetical protein